MPEWDKKLKDVNVSVVADGLYTSLLHSNFFSDLGTAQNTIQIPPLAILDYGRYSFVIDVAARRAIARDATGELTIASPVASMMKKFIETAQNVTIKGVGFNYTYELISQAPAAEFVVSRYFREDVLPALGGEVVGAGLKLVTKQEDHLVQISIETVWGNPLALTILINYHHDSPGMGTWPSIVDRFGQFVADVPQLIERVANAETT